MIKVFLIRNKKKIVYYKKIVFIYYIGLVWIVVCLFEIKNILSVVILNKRNKFFE